MTVDRFNLFINEDPHFQVCHGQNVHTDQLRHVKMEMMPRNTTEEPTSGMYWLARPRGIFDNPRVV